MIQPIPGDVKDKGREAGALPAFLFIQQEVKMAGSADIQAPTSGKPAVRVETKLSERELMERAVSLLGLIAARQIGDEGEFSNFYPLEFDLASGARVTKNADFNPDRWAVYFRLDTDVTLRVYPGDYVPAEGAIEIAAGQAGYFENVGQRVSFHNSGTASAHVFAIAMGGGSGFNILGA